MPGESQMAPTSQADPSVLTTEAIARALTAEREYMLAQFLVLETRLDAMDQATKVLHETVTRVPTDIELAVTHLQSVLDERFKSVGTQFNERDTRSERESRDNKVAVDAAFAAQKEAASEQNKSNTLAIAKSEAATTETINKLSELVKSNIDGLREQITDAKERVAAVEQRKEGSSEARTNAAAGFNLAIGVLGLLLTVLIIGIAAYAATH